MVLLYHEFCDKSPMRKTLYILLLPFAFLSCTNKEEEIEREAGRMLDEARTLMAGKDYQAARDSILAMRQNFPTAFNARAAGIIVMDSIELLESQDSLAVMDTILQDEKAILAQLELEKRRGHNAEFYKQRTKVFHLQQQFDEMEAKVKFYLRKIEVDIQENKVKNISK